jgi:PAS domain S-box-containing protein
MPNKRPSQSTPPKRAIEKPPRAKRVKDSLDSSATSPATSQESEQQYRALYASAQRQARELQLLHEVRTALGRDLELPILFRTVVESTAEIFGYSHVSLYLLRADWLVLQHQVGFDQDLIMAQIPITQGISGRVVRSGQAMLLEDVRSNPDFLAAADSITSEVCVPLFDQGQVVGMLNVESTHGLKLSEADLQLMLAVSEYVSLAIERARLYSQLRESEKRYKELVNYAGDIIYKITPSGHFTFVNPAAARIMGYTEQELVGTHYLKLIRAGYRKAAVLFYRKQFTEKIPSTYFEFPAIAKNGAVVWIGQNVQLLMDATGDQVLEAQGITRDITERVQADEALRASEEQFRTLFENAPIGIGVADRQGNLLAFNDAILQPGGYSREDMLKIGNVTALYAASQQRAEAMALFQRQGTLKNYAVQFKRKDGTLYEALLSLTPTVFKGQPCLQAIIEDITERKRAEEELHTSEARFRSLTEATTEGLVFHDKGQIVDVNPALVAMFGYETASELVGRNLLEFIAPESHETVLKQLQSGSTAPYEAFGRRQDGSLFPVEASARLYEYRGRPIRVASIHDITERKRAEEALRDSRVRIDGIIHAAMDAIISIDADQRVVLFNAAAEQMFRYSAAEAIGLPIEHFVPERYRAAHREHFRQFARTGVTSRAMGHLPALSGLRMNGEEFPIEASISQAETAGEKIFTVILRDITERKRAEQVQEALYAIAQAAVSAENLNDLYRSIHHALGQLLPVENFYIALYDANTELISFPYFVDERDKSLPPKRPGRGLTEYVLRTGRPLLADPDVFEHLIQQGEVELIGMDSVDWLGVPLKIGAQIIGVMAMQSYTEGIRFSQKDVDLLAFVSAQIAQAIERKRAEETIKESENQYRRLVEHSPYGVVIHIHGQVAYLNPTGTRLIGAASAEEVLGKPVIDFVHPDSRLAVIQRLRALSEDKEAAPLEEKFIRLDGRVIDVEVAAYPFVYQNKPAVQVVFHDITERKHAEEALRQYVERLAILHEIDQAILAAKSLTEIAHAMLSRVQRLVPSWHAQVILLDFNTGEAFPVAAYEYGTVAPLGPRIKLESLNLPESLGRGELHVVEDLSHLQQPSPHERQLIDQGARAHIDAPLMAAGKIIGYLTLDSKEPAIFRGAILEIVREVADQLAIAIQNAHLLEQTQLHAQELEMQAAALSRALEQQREFDRLQREFTQNVSHELRTPLALVLGHAELLESGEMGDLLPHQQESISVIVRRARMLRKLIEMVIGVSEVENRPLKKVPVDLGRLVESLLTDFQTTAQSSGLTLSVEIVPDLPPIDGDELALLRVVDNLVGNAFKFTPTGGRIDVRLARHEQAILLEVSDTGVGIPGDKLPHIFDRFYQGDSGVSRRFGGLGLGLALVKEIVDGHQGRIEVESQVGVGTTFRVWFPLPDA